MKDKSQLMTAYLVLEKERTRALEMLETGEPALQMGGMTPLLMAVSQLISSHKDIERRLDSIRRKVEIECARG